MASTNSSLGMIVLYSLAVLSILAPHNLFLVFPSVAAQTPIGGQCKFGGKRSFNLGPNEAGHSRERSARILLAPEA